jgi:hypothetical protein
MLAQRIARVVSWSIVVVLGGVFGLVSVAHAGGEASPHGHLEGQILVTQELLPRSSSAERTIELFEQNRQDVVQSDDDAATRWSFRFMAFMTEEPRTGQLSLELYRADDERWVASTRLFASPRMTILSGRASFSADEGVEVGLNYKLKLVAERAGERVVLAETRLITEAPMRVASR